MGRVFQVWLVPSDDPINGVPFAIPAGATNIFVHCGGAGGAGKSQAPAGTIRGGGGGGGEIAVHNNFTQGAGATVRVIVGRGGAGLVEGNGEKSAVIPPGGGQVRANGGLVGPEFTAPGGAGGTGGIGTTTIDGNAGDSAS